MSVVGIHYGSLYLFALEHRKRVPDDFAFAVFAQATLRFYPLAFFQLPSVVDRFK